jgi:DTW domain-containing protein YfiP
VIYIFPSQPHAAQRVSRLQSHLRGLHLQLVAELTRGRQHAGVHSAGATHPLCSFANIASPAADSRQNRREVKRKSNSVSLLRLCLPPSALHVMSGCHPGRRNLEACPAYTAACEQGRVPLLLYPRAGALTEAEVRARASAGAQFSLVVIDGNWTEATEISRALDTVMALFTLDVGKYKGLFSLRRPKEDGFLSTLEAVAYALDVIEPTPASPQLLPPMLRICLQEVEFAVRRGGGVKHRPHAPGYRAGLIDDVRAAAAAFGSSAKQEEEEACSAKQEEEEDS